MPSGSHFGGGGGSHFGGGSSGGSHFGGSSSGGSRYNGPRQPGRYPIHYVYYMRGGRRYAINMSSSSHVLYRIFCIVCIFFCIFSFLLAWETSSDLEKVKSDYQYYQDMINYALTENENGNSNYLVDGIIISKYKNDTSDGKWYITYYFLTPDNERVEGYTYSIYTYEQVKNVHPYDIIELAVDSDPITTETDSINLDYKDIPLTQDGEYVHNKKVNIFSIAIGIVTFGLSILMFVLMIKNKKKNSEEVALKGEMGDTPVYKYVCTYCGAKLRETDSTCPHCGSGTIETRESDGRLK